jgi:hypothetical protein
MNECSFITIKTSSAVSSPKPPFEEIKHAIDISSHYDHMTLKKDYWVRMGKI